MIGFPYGDSGLLIDFDGWETSSDSPLMSAGPDDDETDWVEASPDAGTFSNEAHRIFAVDPITTTFTATFTHYYIPDTGQQDTYLNLMRSDTGATVLSVGLHFSGTGSGSNTTGELLDTSGGTAELSITLPAGQANAIKVTYDGTNVRLYVNTVLQMTWPHVLLEGPSNIDQGLVFMQWATGPGGHLFVKDFEVHPGLL